MDIAYTITSFWPALGGAEIHTRQLAINMASRNRVRALAQLDRTPSEWLEEPLVGGPPARLRYDDGGIETIFLRPSTCERALFSGILKLYHRCAPAKSFFMKTAEPTFSRKIVRALGGCDLIHNVHLGLNYFSLASLDAAKKLGAAFVFTPLVKIDWKPGWTGGDFERLYAEANALIAMTEYEKDWLAAHGADESKIHVVGVGPVLEPWDGRSDFKKSHKIEGPVVLFAGRKTRSKGYLHLLEAAPKVWAELKNVHFVLAGPKGDASAPAGVAADPRIIDIGPILGQEKAAAFACCDIYCMPSYEDNFGGVFLEAWANGKPVVGGDVPCERCLIEDGSDGFLVKQDPHEIAGAILKLLSDEGLRDEMGRKGKEKVLVNYTWDKIAAKTARAYERALARKE